MKFSYVKKDIKDVSKIFANQFRGLLQELRSWRFIRALKRRFINYVPKYGTRSEAEHASIRKRLRVNPSRCDHLKGGRYKLAMVKDYNVSFHTFVDGVSRIRCNKCGAKWFSGDPGWTTALGMAEQSTNQPSSSEVPLPLPSK